MLGRPELMTALLITAQKQLHVVELHSDSFNLILNKARKMRKV
jgi:hypothetical protein